MNLAKFLDERGLVFQHTGESLEEITKTKRTIYMGIDPTADSLHVGSLLALMVIRHFLSDGHKVVILVGGGTATIGDPSGKTEERVLLDEETVKNNSKKMREQITKVLGSGDFIIADNAEWLGTVPILSFLRDIGKHFSVNEMLRKESVRHRIEDEDSSISFTEFSYMLLQAYDFYVLNRDYDCDLQFGGSDQWGNITAGIELIRKKTGKEAHGITSPLLLDKKTGRKFGKTESGTIWLDPKKTSAFHFFQFWFNTPDDVVEDYLKYYTSESVSKIKTLVEKSKEEPEKRVAQTFLANKVTSLIHGDEMAKSVENVSKAIFSNKFDKLTDKEKQILFEVVPCFEVKDEISLVDLLVESSLAKSKRDARTLIESGAVSIDGEKIKDTSFKVDKNNFKGGMVVLKKGKREILILH
jgi:tyrosyl-tRNA synthetase